MRTATVMLICFAVVGVAVSIHAVAPGGPAAGGTVETAYPGMACGALTHAKLGELPDGVLLRAGEVEITLRDLKKAISAMWYGVQPQFEAFPFLALEQEAAQRILRALAGMEAAAETAEQEAGAGRPSSLPSRAP